MSVDLFPPELSQYDKFDICEAWYVFAADWHGGQWSDLYEVFGLLQNAGFSPGLSCREDGYDGLTEQGQEIYDLLKDQFGFDTQAEAS